MSAVRASIATLALALSLSTVAHAQVTPPRACASSAAATLIPMTRFSPVSAVMTAPATLWVLYSDHDARNIDAVSLVEVRGIGGRSLEVETHEVGEGTVTRNSLAVIHGNIVAAWVQTDHHVGVYVHPLTGGGVDRRVALDAPQVPTSVSVSAVGSGALIAWDDNTRGLRYARLDANGGLVGTVTALAGRFSSLVVTALFDGLVMLQNAAHIRFLAPGARRPTPLRGAARIGGVSSPSVASASSRGYVAFTAAGSTHLTTLDAAAGDGHDHVLGPSGRGGETGLVATPWGTFAAWTLNGAIQVVPVDSDGVAASSPFEVTDPVANEGARAPAVAGTPQMVAVVWYGVPARRPAGHAGAIRFVRLDCH